MSGLCHCVALVSLAYGTVSSKPIHIAAGVRILSLRRMSNIPVCGGPTVFYPFICQWTRIRFHLSAMVNNAAINLGLRGSIWFPIFKLFWHIPRSGDSGSDGHPMFSCLRNYQTVFHQTTVAAPFYIPTGALMLWFLHVLSGTCYFPLFATSHPNGGEVCALLWNVLRNVLMSE